MAAGRREAEAEAEAEVEAGRAPGSSGVWLREEAELDNSRAFIGCWSLWDGF